jgi:hypothetical protein
MRISVDVGGTFTDVIVLDQKTNRLRLEKVETTPPFLRQERWGDRQALRQALVTPDPLLRPVRKQPYQGPKINQQEPHGGKGTQS